jgi:hypothetical protein
MAYALLRDSYSFTMTQGENFEDTEAEGSANLEFIYKPEATQDLPNLGDKLNNLEFYGSGSSTTEYTNILAKSIKKVPYSYNGMEFFKWVVTFNSEGTINNEFFDFTAAINPMSMDSPANWRYAQDLTDAAPPITGTNIQGNIDAPVIKLVTVGSFKLRKLVAQTVLPQFWEDYTAVVSKINEAPVYVLGESPSNALLFAQGQILTGGIDNGTKDDSGLYPFEVTFHYRLIGDKNATKTEVIIDNDWQYALAPVAGGDAGWWVPIQIEKNTKETPEENPWTYGYTEEGELETLLTYDYSTEE